MVARRKQGQVSNPYTHVTKGWREFPGGKRYFLQSLWEINVAHFLEWLRLHGEIEDWEYEPETFWFEQIRRGVRSYTPDFRVREKGGSHTFYEVKGWMDQKSRTKLDRMARYYPAVKLVVIGSTEYKELRAYGRLFGFEEATIPHS